MDIKWIGAVLIIAASGGFGFSLTAAHRREEASLRSFIRALDFMVSELCFRATPLPALCRMAAGECEKSIEKVLSGLADNLDQNVSPDAAECLESAMQEVALPALTQQNLRLLASSLGRFDLDGQLKGLESVRASCRTDLDKLTSDREMRFRNYQTLSLCAGAALAILLI